MHDVRLIYKKQGKAKYISHLDMNRLIPRVLRRSGLPIWYTQGFNQRVHVVFSLPLSLGYESEYDIVDFRITDDEMSNETVLCALKSALPEGIVAVDVINPILKPKDVKFAEFTLDISCDKSSADIIKAEFNNDSILVTKTTKKGKINTLDVKEFMPKYDISDTDSGILVHLVLSAGNENNINPAIIFDKIKKDGADFKIESVVRGRIFDEKMKLFC